MPILVAVLVVLLVLFFALCAIGIGIYNGLVSLRQQVDRAWANIDVILKQRFDEIPQIVQVLEQFVAYEKGVINNLVEARKHYGSAQSTDEKMKASGEMTMALRGVFAIGEGYPELKSNQNFLQLQGRVTALEESLSDRREQYNEVVTNFNTRLEQIPDVFFARILGYTGRQLFQVSEAEKARPSLKLNLPS